MKTPVFAVYFALFFLVLPIDSMAENEAKCCVWVDAGWSLSNPVIHVEKMAKTNCEKLPGYSKSYFEKEALQRFTWVEPLAS